MVTVVRVNVGCGATPTPGWINLDSSWTVRLARSRRAFVFLGRLGLIGPEQQAFARVVRERDIRWSDARRLPFEESTVHVVYTSHMVEHLTREELSAFLAEAKRVLLPAGVLRIAIPDLALLVRRYCEEGDADRFVSSTLLAQQRPRGLRARLRAGVVGARHHAWMYDGPSLVKVLGGAGFQSATIVPAGTTTIPDPGALSLRERQDESVYVEARKPRDS